ncbi:MAG: type II toxin-antitoxin system YafQ family toxin [Flavobacteriaceae bacterium]|nr:type II toxin-antitoxin system YafQ family toxin [Flavobacteriaceae bacterium]
MYILKETTQFKKDLKRVIKRGSKDSKLIKDTLIILKMNGVNGIHPKMNPHELKGIYIDYWECHIKPDLLIIWFQIENPKTIKLIRLGSHSDLFK